MALLVTLFLVLVNIFNTVTTNTPKAEGLTAIEAWMLSCILFVFATLIEYACLLFSKEPTETPEINELRRYKGATQTVLKKVLLCTKSLISLFCL